MAISLIGEKEVVLSEKDCQLQLDGQFVSIQSRPLLQNQEDRFNGTEMMEALWILIGLLADCKMNPSFISCAGIGIYLEEPVPVMRTLLLRPVISETCRFSELQDPAATLQIWTALKLLNQICDLTLQSVSADVLICREHLDVPTTAFYGPISGNRCISRLLNVGLINYRKEPAEYVIFRKLQDRWFIANVNNCQYTLNEQSFGTPLQQTPAEFGALCDLSISDLLEDHREWLHSRDAIPFDALVYPMHL